MLPPPSFEAPAAEDQDDVTSIATSSLKDMNKHERCIFQTPLHKAFSGKNIAEHMSKLKRASTVAQKEGVPEWVVKIDDHQTFFISASMCTF